MTFRASLKMAVFPTLIVNLSADTLLEKVASVSTTTERIPPDEVRRMSMLTSLALPEKVRVEADDAFSHCSSNLPVHSAMSPE